MARWPSAGIDRPKKWNGAEEDERKRVRDALAQLLYYEAFVTEPIAGAASISKVACFEHQLSDRCNQGLIEQGIATTWKNGDEFAGDRLAHGIFESLLERPD